MIVKIISGFIAVIVVGAFFGSFYTVDQGERAVILRYGEVLSVNDAGLHFKAPIIDKVERISVQSRLRRYENIATYSFDQQPATMNVSVNYRVNPDAAAILYGEYGDRDTMRVRLIDPQLQEQFKTVFGQFTAVQAIQERERLNLEVTLALQEAVLAEGNGVASIDSIQVENIDFSTAYEQSIEDRMLAEVAVQKVQQDLEREIVEAEIVVVAAQAGAQAVVLNGEAEAAAINARGQALRDNPNLVQLVQAERWNGVLPTTMLPNGTVPIIGVP